MTPRFSLPVLLTLALTGLTVLGGCSRPETAGQPEATAGPDTTLQAVTINYPTRSGGSWPLFIAKHGGYYEKNGLDVTLAFGSGSIGIAMITSGEAVMTNSSMEQALQASSRDPGALVSMGSLLNKGTFSLMAGKDISAVGDLKGKRLAVSQIGDAPYSYTIALLSKFGLGPRDVTWIPVGVDANARAAALQGNRADATLLTAPSYFRMEEAGFRNLANMADYDDIYASSVFLFTRKTVAADPELPEKIIRAETEAIKRFYDDKEFAVDSFLAFDEKQQRADIERIYDLYADKGGFERVPYVLADAVNSIVAQAAEQQATQMKAIDFKTVVDNSVVDKLAKEGFFETVFGPQIKNEQEDRSKRAMR